MQKIIFVSHCILNTASKVASAQSSNQIAEEAVRQEFLMRVLKSGIQLFQLPCPEFTLYGASRWGHVREQFDNPFFRKHCQTLLKPVILQMQEYLAQKDKFHVMGVVGIEGSPSCGVSFTCSGDWGGEIADCDTVPVCSCISGQGILIQELCFLMDATGIKLPVIGLNPEKPQMLYDFISDS